MFLLQRMKAPLYRKDLASTLSVQSCRSTRYSYRYGTGNY